MDDLTELRAQMHRQTASTLPISFWADGEPKGQPRPRAFRRGNRAAVYDPGTAEGWKGQIALAVRGRLPSVPIEGPLYVSAIFLMPRPKSLMRNKDPDGMIPCPKKPDNDNLEKALYDCLTQLGFWRDDAQIVYSRTQKYYHEKNGRPGVSVVIDHWQPESALTSG